MKLFSEWLFYIVPRDSNFETIWAERPPFNYSDNPDWKFENLKKILNSIEGIKNDSYYEERKITCSGNSPDCYYVFEAPVFDISFGNILFEINHGENNEDIPNPQIIFKIQNSPISIRKILFEKIIAVLQKIKTLGLKFKIYSVPHENFISLKKFLKFMKPQKGKIKSNLTISKFSGFGARYLIPQYAKFSNFSEKSEKEAMDLINPDKDYTLGELLLLLTVSGVKNMDFFDISSLCLFGECSLDEFNKLYSRDFSSNYLPLLFTSNEFKNYKSKLKKELELCKRDGSESSKKEESLIVEAIERLDEWVKNKRIIIEDLAK